MHLFLVASLFLVVRPRAPSSVLVPSGDALCSVRSFLFLHAEDVDSKVPKVTTRRCHCLLLACQAAKRVEQDDMDVASAADDSSTPKVDFDASFLGVLVLALPLIAIFAGRFE